MSQLISACRTKKYRNGYVPGNDPISIFVDEGRFIWADPYTGEQQALEYDLTPRDAVGFFATPRNCESCMFYLADYPRYTAIVEKACDERKCLRNLWFDNGTAGWRSFASCTILPTIMPGYNPNAHFVRCHLAVIRLLDYAEELGILEGVFDIYGMWQRRKAIVKQFGDWNQLFECEDAALGDVFERATEWRQTAELYHQRRMGR